MKEKVDSERDLVNRIEELFSRYSEIDSSQEILLIGEYFDFLAESINQDRFTIEVDHRLLDVFESVVLLLKDRLILYPDSITKQIDRIFEELKLFETIGVLSLQPFSGLYRDTSKSHSSFSLISLADSMALANVIRRKSKQYGISEKALIDVRIGLKRISQILKYASILEMVDYDGDLHDFGDHFNPNLVNKTKVITVINLLRLQAQHFQDPDIRRRIEKKLDRLEKEIRKPKPKWGRIIAGFFILLGFFADLKTLKPEIYDQPYKMASKIVSIIFDESQVKVNTGNHLLDDTKSTEDSCGIETHAEAAILPKNIEEEKE
jgi:hypothetical protein